VIGSVQEADARCLLLGVGAALIVRVRTFGGILRVNADVLRLGVLIAFGRCLVVDAVVVVRLV
jgi:hypothetical protein